VTEYSSTWGEFVDEITPERAVWLAELRLAGMHPHWCVFWALFKYRDETDQKESLESLTDPVKGSAWQVNVSVELVRKWMPKHLQDKYLK
jgi:hypothetical protein